MTWSYTNFFHTTEFLPLTENPTDTFGGNIPELKYSESSEASNVVVFLVTDDSLGFSTF